MVKTYSYNELKGKLKVGDQVRAVPGKNNPCCQLQDDGSNTASITDVGPNSFGINACLHSYSKNAFLELMTVEKTFDNLSTLEVGDELECRNGDTKTILGICGRVLLLSQAGDPEMFGTGYTVEEIRGGSWKLKAESTATQMTVAEVEAKLGYKVEIIADK